MLLAFVLLAKTSAVAQSLGAAKSVRIVAPQAARDFDLRKILQQNAGEDSRSKNFELGRECFLGSSGSKVKDFRLAAHYFALAADEGSSAGQVCLALMLYRGEGAGVDIVKAKAMLERAKRGPLNDRFVRLAWYLDDLLAAAAVNSSRR